MGQIQRLTRGPAAPYSSVPTVDWTHPLARGLIGCYLPGTLGGHAVVGPNLAIGDSGISARGMTKAGLALASTTIGSNAGLIGPAPVNFKTGSQFSLFWQGTIASSSNDAFSNIIGVTYDSGDNSPFSGYTISPTSSNNWFFTSAQWNTGGTNIGGGSFSLLSNIGVLSTLAATFRVGGNTTAYLNGAVANTSTFGASAPNFAAAQINIQQYIPGHTRSTNSLCNVAFFFNVEKTASEILQLNQDPYCFLIYPEDDATLVGVSSGGNIFNVSATEAGSASEVETVIATFAATDSESGIAVDTPSASAVFAASDTEAGTAADTSSGAWVTSSTITEAGTAADSETVTASFASSLTEAGSAADSYVATAVFVASETEAGSASDSPSSTAIFAASDTEAASAADSESSTGAVISDGVIEAAVAAETETAIVTFAAAASEAGSAADTSSNTAIFSAVVSEAGSAGDAEDANGVFVASDTEAATATDLSNGVIPGPPSTDGPHSNPFFATPGPMTAVQ